MVKFVGFCCHHLRGGVDWNFHRHWERLKNLGSPASRWCGLKFVWGFIIFIVVVTTFAVVWIEIFIYPSIHIACAGHHLRGGVDWNLFSVLLLNTWQSHHLRGGVDWNYPCSQYENPGCESPPSRWCGLKLSTSVKISAPFRSPPSRWCGLK